MPEIIQTKLANGVEVVILENHFAKAVAVQCWVGVGALDERDDQRGMAHYLEHMLFKGTKRRAVGEIASAVEACGGEINAYTSFDHTVYYLTLGTEYRTDGIDILADAVAHSTFDPEEFERERQVILEEIRRGEDDPGAKVGRRVFELSYAGTEAGRPITGSEESVEAFTRDGVVAFYKDWYVPENLRVLVVGDVDPEKTLEEVRQGFGGLTAKAVPARQRPARLHPTGPTAVVIKGDYQQPRIEMAFPAPSLEDPGTPALDLASFALGSGEMSRLSRRLRDRDGSVVAASASLYAPDFGGLFSLSAYSTLENIPAAVEGLAREVSLIGGGDPINTDELERARTNLRADRIFRDETVDGQARSLGQGMRTRHLYMFDDVYAAQIGATPASAVTSSVGRWLAADQAVIVALVPDDSPLSEEDLLAAYGRGREGDAVQAGQSGSPVRGATEVQTHVTELGPGLTLVYRHNPEGRIFALTLGAEGGLRDEGEGDVGTYNAMAGMLVAASSQRSYEEVVGRVEGLGAGLEGFSGKDSFGVQCESLVPDSTELVNLMAETFLDPRFPDEAWHAVRQEVAQSLQGQDDSPAGMAVRRFQESIFGEHPYRWPLYGTAGAFENLERQAVQDRFVAARDSGPWVIAAAGPQRPDVVEGLVAQAFAGFSPKADRRTFASEDASGRAPEGAEISIPKDREQLHVIYGFHGLTWGDEDRPALDVLINVLGGHGGRLFSRLRDRDGLAYTVTPVVTYGVHPGAVGSYIATSPDKREKAVEGLKREMAALCDDLAEPAELARAQGYIVGTYELSLQRAESQTSTMSLMQLYGYGYDDFLRYPASIRKVTREDVRRVAQRLFDASGSVLVEVGPQG